MIDLHCHLDLYPDHQTAVEKREKEKKYTLSVTTTPLAWPQNRDLARDKRYVRAALGLHPQLIADRAAEISLWKKYLPEAKYVGEVGLDAGPAHKASFEKQKEVFTEILRECASAGDKILTVHSVRAAKDVLELVELHLPSSRGKVILHWFTGGKAQVKKALDLGCFFSFNADMLQTKRGRETALLVPLDKVFTETDAPFTKFPSIEYALELLAEIHQTSPNAVEEIILGNLKKLLA